MSTPEQMAREAGIDRCDTCGGEHHSSEHGDPERPPIPPRPDVNPFDPKPQEPKGVTNKGFYKGVPRQVLEGYGIKVPKWKEDEESGTDTDSVS